MPQATPKSANPTEEEKYQSPFDLPSFIILMGCGFLIDTFSWATFFVASTLFSFVLWLIFYLMKVKNAWVNKVFIGFASVSVYIAIVYAVEKAKELSPSLAKADAMASGGALNPIQKK